MNDLRTAAQQALEALEEATNYTGCEAWSPSMTDECLAAATALKAALEQDDKDRVWIEERKAAWAKDKEIARKNAELERERHYTPGPCDIAEDGVCEALECCKEQSTSCGEPYAWMAYDDAYMARRVAWNQEGKDAAGGGLYWEPLYTHPHRREWPEALRLADECDTGYPLEEDAKRAATELRRLHEVNVELLNALKEATRCLAWHEDKHGVGMDRVAVQNARAAIAKAEGQT
jgi:hypothetical protein